MGLVWLAIFPSIVAALLSWGLLGERLSAGQLLGAGLMLSGMAAASGAAGWMVDSWQRQSSIAH